MPLQRFARSLGCIAMAGLALGLVGSCAKNPLRVDRNRPPRTFLVAAPIDSTIAHPTATGVSYSYRVHLYWRGVGPGGALLGLLLRLVFFMTGDILPSPKQATIFYPSSNRMTDFIAAAPTN